VAGVGHSPVDRRWDGVSMDQTLGAYSILACHCRLIDQVDLAKEARIARCAARHCGEASEKRHPRRPVFLE